MIKTEKYYIEGSYYEACNCEAICPCRQQNGATGGLSTYGNCDFLFSWHIINGNAGSIDLSGLSVCMGGHYHDDDEGQPWSVYIYIDEVATENQFDALKDIFQGKAGGNILFTNYIAEVLGVKRARIVLDHTAGKETINIGNIASVKVVKTVSFDGTVSCSIPGHDRPGKESVSSILYSDGPFEWDYQERCGFSTDFAYCR